MFCYFLSGKRQIYSGVPVTCNIPTEREGDYLQFDIRMGVVRHLEVNAIWHGICGDEEI